MDGRQAIACQEEQRIMQELLANVGELIKDSDAVAEKEMVKAFLQQVAQAVTVVVAGDSSCGKTSLLNAVLPVSLPHTTGPTQGIVETRYGAQDMAVQVEYGYVRQFISAGELEGIAAYDMQGLDTLPSGTLREKAKEVIQKSSVLFVLFDVARIRSFSVWEFLEEVDRKKMVFVMTGCDRVSAEQVRENERKLRGYMQEEGIEAPLYCVSLGTAQQEETIAPLREYVRREILGEYPVLTNQMNQVKQLEGLLCEVKKSFALRKRQFEADHVILQDIDRSLNTFTERNEEVVERLKRQLRQVIAQEIDDYRNNVIKRLDPKKIKERFKGGEAAFQEYLTTINENYKNLLNERVSQETQRAVKGYLADLENVFEEATGVFRKRKNLMALEDRFYGSLAESKRGMIQKTENTLAETTSVYQTLSQASEELFYKVWAAREKYDKQVAIGTAVGAGVGAGAGVGLGLLAAHIAGAGATAAATAAAGTGAAGAVAAAAQAGAAAAAFWPVIGCIIGAVVIALIARKLAKACSGANMMQAVEECIREFKQETSKIKEQLIHETMEIVDRIFARELEGVDKSFLEFRMSVNIDSKKIPMLEQKMDIVDTLMEQVARMKERAVAQRMEGAAGQRLEAAAPKREEH